MVPPCISVNCFAIESPKPRPLRSRAIPASACRNRSNTCGKNSGRDADAGVAHGDLHVRIHALKPNLDLAAPPRELHRIGEEIPQDLLQSLRVTGHRRGLRVEHCLERGRPFASAAGVTASIGVSDDRREIQPVARSAESSQTQCERCRERLQPSASAMSRFAQSFRLLCRVAPVPRCPFEACARSRGWHSRACAIRETGWRESHLSSDSLPERPHTCAHSRGRRRPTTRSRRQAVHGAQ